MWIRRDEFQRLVGRVDSLEQSAQRARDDINGNAQMTIFGRGLYGKSSQHSIKEMIGVILRHLKVEPRVTDAVPATLELQERSGLQCVTGSTITAAPTINGVVTGQKKPKRKR